MRLLWLESKRILKTRLTWALLAAALVLSVLLAYMPTTFRAVSVAGANGTEALLRGPQAIAEIKRRQQGIAGEVTPEALRAALETYQACLRENGVESPSELPKGVYEKTLVPVAPLVGVVREAFAVPSQGYAADPMTIDPADVDDYYAVCRQALAARMQWELPDSPAAQQAGLRLYERVNTPFAFYSGQTGEALDYQTILIFLVALLCVTIASSVFSTEYQTQADDILRSTKHGRLRLGVVKAAAAVLVCTLAFAVCMAVFLVLTNTWFGWECTQTSMQMLTNALFLPALTVGQAQGCLALGGLVSFLAAIGFTLFVSSKSKSTMASLAVSVLVCLLPVVLYIVIPGDAGQWLCALLPSGGIGLQNSLWYTILNFNFLSIGPLAVWTPYVMLTAAAVQIPLFFGLAVWGHTRRKLV